MRKSTSICYCIYLFLKGNAFGKHNTSINTCLQEGHPSLSVPALFDWLDEQLASVVRASFLDDIQENHLLAVATAKAAVQSRPPFTPASPLVDLEEDYLLAAIRGRAETAYLVREMKWRFAQVNLNEVLTFQPSVRIDNLDNRVPASLLSKEQLYKLCFPSLPSDLI